MTYVQTANELLESLAVDDIDDIDVWAGKTGRRNLRL